MAGYRISTAVAEAEIANAGAHLTIDAAARQDYGRQIKLLAEELRTQASHGAITWAEAAQKEGAVTAAGIGGALAGLACGPGAPVCVTVGAVVGGALAAFGVDDFW